MADVLSTHHDIGRFRPWPIIFECPSLRLAIFQALRGIGTRTHKVDSLDIGVPILFQASFVGMPQNPPTRWFPSDLGRGVRRPYLNSHLTGHHETTKKSEKVIVS
jgi:hypothetical protein